MKTHKTKSGKKIRVWDGLIDYATASYFYQYAENSFYKLGWTDGESENQRKYRYLHARLTIEESMNNRVFPALLQSEVAKYLKGATLEKSVINLSTPSDIHYPHVHPEKFVALYYVNPLWQPQWYGETLFWNETATEIEVALPYTPHRLILFDANIPHSIRPQSRDAESHRFTYAMVFN